MGLTVQQKKDNDWFRKNISKLYDTYGYSYVVIKKGKILGSYASEVEGIKAMKNREKLGTFIVERCAPSTNDNIQFISSTMFL